MIQQDPGTLRPEASARGSGADRQPPGVEAAAELRRALATEPGRLFVERLRADLIAAIDRLDPALPEAELRAALATIAYVRATLQTMAGQLDLGRAYADRLTKKVLGNGQL